MGAHIKKMKTERNRGKKERRKEMWILLSIIFIVFMSIKDGSNLFEIIGWGLLIGLSLMLLEIGQPKDLSEDEI